MREFSLLQPLEALQFERLSRLQFIQKRIHLKIIQGYAVSSLEKKKVEFLTGLPGYQELEEPIQHWMSFPLVNDWAKFLDQSTRGLIEIQEVEDKIQRIKENLGI